MSAQSNGLVAAAKQNEAGGVTPHNVSTFPLSYSFYCTERFGELSPFFVEEGISGDKLPLHSTHELRTYTLEAPLMQSLLKKKDFFYVPMQAILPLNWDKFYTNPVIGEDVPDDVGCGVVGFWSKVASLFGLVYSSLGSILSGSGSSASKMEAILRFLVFFEYFYSTGSLMESLGISGHTFLKVTEVTQNGNEYAVFDQLFDAVLDEITKYDISLLVNFGDDYYNVSTSPAKSALNAGNNILYREFLEILRDDLANFSVSQVYFPSSAPITASTLFSRLAYIIGQSSASFSDISQFLCVPVDDESVPLNLSRLWAYQLVCAHFYSNDHVDFVFSAELYRQYIRQIYRSPFADEWTDDAFSVNGFYYQYDELSAHCFNRIFDSLVSSESPLSQSLVAYFTALLHFKRSLRYMDYFSGARTRPLAVGDASVDVADNKVDVLDLSRSRMMAKFLQAVNRSGRKFGAYMKELFGKVPAPDYHNPFYLAHTSDVVGSSENQNTADGQRAANAFTSNMITNASRYVFTFHPDRDCVVIGITYYDIPRVYTRATERQNFFVDRFDMFNPYLQFIGDQPIYTAEIGTDNPSCDVANPFGYQNRHMEYKQRYNQAAGGFANPSTQLDNWIFVADLLRRSQVEHISSSFIRSFNSELDHFYTSLTGWSNGSYFHFICRYDNRQDATRPMAYAPVIA